MSNLQDGATLAYYRKTILKDKHGKQRKGEVATLQYLLDFLAAYDFGSETSDDVFAKEYKPIINPSVLGLIFEKINGYKDGSFFTPSFITMYMSRKTLHAALIPRFNETFNWQAENFEILKRLCDREFGNNEFEHKAAEIIDSITICDPAVGSGHFLVSMLNEIIYTKYQLGVLDLKRGRLQLENDELFITFEGEPFQYYAPQNKKQYTEDHQYIQKTLFEEKQRIIESQLFGVDINSNSTNITKLRLWIELLKNSYYDLSTNKLVTLPNIDINIKTGNSLVSRFPLTDGFGSSQTKAMKKAIKSYKEKVNEYKIGQDDKKAVLGGIDKLKAEFRDKLFASNKIVTKRNRVLNEYVANFGKDNLPDDLFLLIRNQTLGQTADMFGGEEIKTTEKHLLTKLKQSQKEVIEFENNKIYDEAFEWRIEFPEVLDDEGNFVGFDIVVGNPPYFNIDAFGAKSAMLNYLPQNYPNIYMDKSDILFYFIAIASRISHGQTAFIVSNAMLSAQKARKLRDYLIENNPVAQIINFEQYQVFDEASITSMMLFLDKSHKGAAKVKNFQERNYEKNALNAQIENYDFLEVIFNKGQPFVLINSEVTALNKKIDSNHPQLGALLHVGSGMQTAANKVFAFKEKPTQFPDKYLKKRMSGEIIKQYIHGEAEEYLLYLEDEVSLELLPSDVKEYILDKKNTEKLKNRAEIKRNSNRDWWKYTFPMHKDYYNLPKIWTSYRARDNTFCLDETDDFIGLTNTTAIFGNKKNINLKYALALLNSKLLNFRYKSIGKQTGGGVFEYFEHQVSRLPIPDISLITQQPFVEIIDKMLQIKKDEPKSDISELQNKIDQMVYKLYGLNKRDIEVIDKSLI